jgi:uncharacterized lipoprotein YbaY
MKKLTILLALVVLTTFACQSVFAQVNQTVTLEVKAINKISVSGPVFITIDDAVAGSGPTAVSDNATTYSITHNSSATGKVTASINTALPSGIKLEITLASTIGTGSKVDISNATTAVQVVSGIAKGMDVAQPITYDFSATAAAGTLASVAKTVTLTVSD